MNRNKQTIEGVTVSEERHRRWSVEEKPVTARRLGATTAWRLRVGQLLDAGICRRPQCPFTSSSVDVARVDRRQARTWAPAPRRGIRAGQQLDTGICRWPPRTSTSCSTDLAGADQHQVRRLTPACSRRRPAGQLLDAGFCRWPPRIATSCSACVASLDQHQVHVLASAESLMAVSAGGLRFRPPAVAPLGRR